MITDHNRFFTRVGKVNLFWENLNLKQIISKRIVFMMTCNLVSLKIQEEFILHANDHKPQQIFQSHKAVWALEITLSH